MPYLYFYLLEVNNKRSCVKGHLFPHQFKRLKSKYQSMSLHLPSLTVLIPFPSFSHMHSPSSHFELPLHVPCPAATLTCPLPQSPLHGLCPAVTLTCHLPQSPIHVSCPAVTHTCPLPRSHQYMSPAPQSPLHVPCPAVTRTCPQPHSHPYMASALQSPIHGLCPAVTLAHVIT